MYKEQSGRLRPGFYMNQWLKDNIDNYFIKAVEAKWDCVVLITGMEGSAKSTNAMTIAAYIDPTFPGELVPEPVQKEDEKVREFNKRHERWSPAWRTTDRIVFTFDQFIKAIDTSLPRQCIVFDEAVNAMNSQDASSEMQKILVKKMTMIRKKRLYIFICIPTIFMLRRYFAVARARALIHFYSPDGISRGVFRFYNYEDKRKLYFRGFKEWDMHAAKESFKGDARDTTGFYFDMDDYEAKKDAAIKELTDAPKKAAKNEGDMRKKIRETRDKLVFLYFHKIKDLFHQKYPEQRFTMDRFVKYMKIKCNIDLEEDLWQKAYADGRKVLGMSKSVGEQGEGQTTGDYTASNK